MRIEVTNDHIKRGKRKSGNYCPVAIAVREQVELVACVEVCDQPRTTISFWKDDEEFIEIDAPDSVVDFIQKFDNGEKVKPFSFELAI